jgi:hypothetical protein
MDFDPAVCVRIFIQRMYKIYQRKLFNLFYCSYSRVIPYRPSQEKKLLNAPSSASPLTSLGRRRTSLPQLRRNEQAFITTHPHPRALPPLWQL